MVMPDEIWAGTEHSLMQAVSAMQNVMALGATYSQVKPREEERPYLLSTLGSVGVIRIAGPLVNNDSAYNRYYNITSYADIRRAAIFAAQDSSIKVVLLDINSGGGMVSGISDTANLLATINKDLKPVVAFSDGGMLSAAYWTGATARKIYASNTANLGSVGVITTHIEMSKMLADAGVGVTVLRAGEFKALASNVEPLSDPARAQIMAQLEGTYKVFIEHVAAARGMSVEAADKSIGQGRVFLGQAAVAAGAADAITSFDDLVGTLQALFP
jgi:signal peptide peptidase SppA